MSRRKNLIVRCIVFEKTTLSASEYSDFLISVPDRGMFLLDIHSIEVFSATHASDTCAATRV